MFNIIGYLKAGYPALAIDTFEVKRARNNIEAEGFTIFKWDMINGIQNIQGGQQYTDFKELFNLIQQQTNSVFILENLNMFFESEEVVQLILNTLPIIKTKSTCMVILGSEIKFPPTLEKMITKIDFELPNKEEFVTFINETVVQLNDARKAYNENNKDDPEYKVKSMLKPDINSIANACLGLSMEEGENAISKSIVDTSKLDKQVIYDTKREMLKKTGFLDYLEPVPISEVGGLDNAKDYIYKRKEKWNDPKYPKLKSILLSGLSGTGKTYFGKAVSSIFNVPLIIWDINACKGSLVGETEKNMRIATKTIDAFGMCCCIVDEADKLFAGSTGLQAHSTDSGILAHWLTWMEESKGEKIIIATCNDMSVLPPEFMRRFTVSFFVDYPNFDERKEIINIMNKRYGSKLPTNENFILSLSEVTGAEIEIIAKESLFDDDLENIINNAPLLKRLKAKEMKELREKYMKIMRVANKPEKVQEDTGRKVLETVSGLDDTTKHNINKILAKVREKKQ